LAKTHVSRKGSLASDSTDKPDLKSEFKAKLQALEAQVDTCPPTAVKTDKAGRDRLHRTLERHQSTINSIFTTSAEGLDLRLMNELVDCFHQLLSISCPPELLQSAKLGTLVSKVHNLSVKGRSHNLRKLAKVAERIVHKLQTGQSSFIPNLCLRKRVCQKIAASLQSIGFAKEKAQELALELEGKLRKKDPTMGRTYRHYFNYMHKDFTSHSTTHQ
jgi:hypothetical protein